MKTVAKTMTTDLKTNYDTHTNTSESRIAVNRTLKMRQTTCNWIKRILDKAT